VLPALDEGELELVLELWDALGEDMRGVRVRWMEPEPAPPPPRRLHVAPLLWVPPLPDGCAGEADEAFVAPRSGALPVIIELENGAGDPPADLDWADLAGDDEWVPLEEDEAPPVSLQGCLF
jgi:hypothetical protein